MTIESSILVEFKTSCESADGYLSVELDDELNGDRSCFLYGEKVYFRIYHSPNLTITVGSSDGTIFLESVNSIESLTENVSFANENIGSLSKFIKSITSYSWFGRSLGTILKTGDTSIRAAKTGVAVAAVSYTTQYDVYSLILSDKGVEEYPVLVLVSGNV
ncbi:MAG: hypothetical protein EHM49_00130 [Deltaproteobacteria bacterium]|nr:MAG: hypothetical protein EHM49_00130 [Deltaproteobacteria bacterium]